MDANGTRFHLLLGEKDWARYAVVAATGQPLSQAFTAARRGEEPAVSWSKRGELTLGERITLFPTAPANQPPDPSQRRGAAVDELGEIFWISDDEHDILVARPNRDPQTYWTSRAFTPHPPSAPSPLAERRRTSGGEALLPSARGEGARSADEGSFHSTPETNSNPNLTLKGLAILRGGFLIAGAPELHGLLVFDLRTGSAPRQLVWPHDVPFEPFDLAETADGGVVVLDRSRVWEINSSFEIVARWRERDVTSSPLFRAVDGHDTACEAPPATLDDSFEVDADAIAVETVPDGSILVLSSTIRRYRHGNERGQINIDRAHDFAVVRRGDEQLLYVVGAGGDQAFVFRLTFENDLLAAEPLPDFVALRLFGGKGLAAAGESIYYDFGDRWLPLVTQTRVRYQRAATVRVLQLDGKQHDCVWHRLFLDACIPPGCDVLVATRAANDAELLDAAPLMSEPRIIRRRGGSELPWTSGTCEAGIDTWELLFQRARGRYLQIELTLVGTGRATPRIRALRAYYPRYSYLEHYLPGVYRETPESSAFLDRFLALFEGFFTTIEDRIAAAQLLVDVRTSPTEALEWLAGWLAIAFDESWSDYKRRLFLAHAVEFFEWRGTPRGLLAALRLALDDCPDESIFDFEAAMPPTGIRIQEAFRRRAFESPSSALRAPSPLAEGRRLSNYEPPSPRVSGEKVPKADEGLQSVWKHHLQRLFGSASALNLAYGTSYLDLTAVRPDDELLAGELQRFQSVVMPLQETAHRFAVFLPLPPGSTDGPRRIDLARRVIELEKPAHTLFTVDFYWTWFRLGEARLGEDTVVDLGSRSPSLIDKYTVGETRIGSGYLAPDASRIGPGRTILGRSCRRSPSSSGELR